MLQFVEATAAPNNTDLLYTDPRIALRLMYLLDDPDASLAEITRTISADPALVARVLAVANAPYYAEASEVTTIPKACWLLGASTIRTLAATAAFAIFSTELQPFSEELWTRAVTTALAAAEVAQEVGVSPQEAHVAGLLRNIGAMFSSDVGRDPCRGDLGAEHADIGMQVLLAMGIPAKVATAVGDHHSRSGNESGLAMCVRVADAVAHVIEGWSEAASELEHALRTAGIDPSRAGRLVQRTRADLNTLLADLNDHLPATNTSSGRS